MKQPLRITFGIALLLYSHISYSQLIVNGGTITIEAGATVKVEGDVTANTDFAGAGKLLLNGTAKQQLNANGFAIPNLEVANDANIVLAGDAKVTGSLTFTAGKIQAANSNFLLSSAATITGVGAGKYFETNGTGLLQREITAPGTIDMPVGTATDYVPVQYQVNGGTMVPGAFVGSRAVAGAHPKKPVRSNDFISAYWKTAYGGISGATVNVLAIYADGSALSGSESSIYATRYDGANWSLANSSINNSSNTITYNNVSTGEELFAMNKFLLVGAKVFLQGAFNGGVMRDDLRAAGVLPTADPYRTVPYSGAFTHVNNAEGEVVNATVFADNGNDNNIVDWVFLELRSTAGVLIQTRSALVQKDGDIVDVDGINPVYFKNADEGSYVITVRHRNHLGISADPVTYAKSLSIANPTATNRFDFTTATEAQLYGNASAFYNNGTINLLWAGNANSNGNVRYTGPANDHNYVLSTELSGNGNSVLNAVYKSGDLNMDGIIRYTGPANDHSFLLTNVLGGNGSTVISQQILQ